MRGMSGLAMLGATEAVKVTSATSKPQMLSSVGTVIDDTRNAFAFVTSSIDAVFAAKNVFAANGAPAVVLPQVTCSLVTFATQWRAVSSRFGAIKDAEHSATPSVPRCENSKKTLASV